MRLIGREIEAEMQQVPLPPNGGSGRRLVIDAAAQDFGLRGIQGFGIGAPAGKVIRTDVLRERYDLDSRSLYGFLEGFRGWPGNRGAVNGRRLVGPWAVA